MPICFLSYLSLEVASYLELPIVIDSKFERQKTLFTEKKRCLTSEHFFKLGVWGFMGLYAGASYLKSHISNTKP